MVDPSVNDTKDLRNGGIIQMRFLIRKVTPDDKEIKSVMTYTKLSNRPVNYRVRALIY